jgi:hypothetical protein
MFGFFGQRSCGVNLEFIKKRNFPESFNTLRLDSLGLKPQVERPWTVLHLWRASLTLAMNRFEDSKKMRQGSPAFTGGGVDFELNLIINFSKFMS